MQWVFQNMGTFPWPNDSSLVFVEGSRMEGPHSLALGTVAPDQAAEYTFFIKVYIDIYLCVYIYIYIYIYVVFCILYIYCIASLTRMKFFEALVRKCDCSI